MRFGIFFIIVLLIVGGVFIAFDKFATQKSVLSSEEKKEAMAKILDRDPVVEAKAERTWQTFEGKYISFSYPTDAKVYKKNPASSVLENFSCGVVSPRVNLTVQVVQGADISDSPAVGLRRNDTKVYKGKEGSIKGYGGIVFTKNESDGAEKAAFFAKGGYIYSIVVSGYQLDPVEEMYQEVVETVGIQ